MYSADSHSMSAKAGWYIDPHEPEFERYFDGTGWTDERRWAPPRPWQATGYGTDDDYYEEDPELERPRSYLLWAVLITVMGFWPLGIPAIWNAARVPSAWARGEVEEAYQYSARARTWTTIASIGSIIFLLVLNLQNSGAANATSML